MNLIFAKLFEQYIKKNDPSEFKITAYISIFYFMLLFVLILPIKIFVDKNRKPEPKDAMKPIFTDILIFKKNKKIVGFSTLSIKNLQSRIIGSESNSDYFPTNSEHQQLEKILSK